MIKKIKTPITTLNERVPITVGRFNFDRVTRAVGRSNTDDSRSADIADPDIHDGTFISSYGYARYALHIPTNTVCLFASKASSNLRGHMQEDGKILATEDGLDKSYIISAYRLPEGSDNIYALAPKLRRDLKRYGEDLGERSEKHFTLYGASFDNRDMVKAENTKAHEQDEFEIYTNGRLAYHIIKSKGRYEVSFHAPTRRKDGSFVPVSLKDKGLTRIFASVSKNIARTPTYEEAHHAMIEHWQRISSKLWDEKNIFEGEGTLFRVKKGAADVYNHFADHGLRTASVTLVVGLLTGLINPKYGLVSGILAAVVHTAMDLVVDEGYIASKKAVQRTREARRKLNIDAYDFGKSAADHFKIQTQDNINKLSPKLDLQRFKADEFVFLTTKHSGVLRDHEVPLDGFRPSSLRAHLLAVHQRGFSSSCFLPDAHTRVDIFQSGLVRLMHEKENGEIVIYARYRADACLVDSLRLPEEKIDTMGDDIWCFTYDRTRDNFHNSFRRSVKPTSLDDMIADLGDNILFRDRPDIAPEVKKRSLGSIKHCFSGPCEPQQTPARYMCGKPVHPPFLKAFA